MQSHRFGKRTVSEARRQELMKKLLADIGLDEQEMLEEAIMEAISPGICIDCSSVSDNMEPDQDQGFCDHCGANAVVAGPRLALII